MRWKIVATALLTQVVLLLALTPSSGRSQQAQLGRSESNTRIVARMGHAEAAHAIVTQNGRATLLLREQGVALQLTDVGLRELSDRKRGRSDAGAGFLARMVTGLIRSNTRGLPDYAVEVPLEELVEARHQNGRLIFVDRAGRRVFHDVKVNGWKVMEDFSPCDAHEFSRRFSEMKRTIGTAR